MYANRSLRVRRRSLTPIQAVLRAPKRASYWVVTWSVNRAEIVHELVLAIELGATAEDIANTMHIHPTLPESINSAAGGVHEPS